MNGFLIDPHVHTAEVSRCGHVPAAEIALLYKQAGFDGIVITDHYNRLFFGRTDRQSPEQQRSRLAAYLEGYRLARRKGEEIGLEVFLGLELKFAALANDYLVYGLDKAFLLANPGLHLLDLESFRDLVKQRQVLIVQAHPFRFGNHPAPARLLEGVEIYNGNPRHDSRNHRAARYARENRLLVTSGSDAHQTEDIGRGGMRLARKPHSIAEFIAGIGDAELYIAPPLADGRRMVRR
jgi:predicted metal-dependent phosphoesterase TrpH